MSAIIDVPDFLYTMKGPDFLVLYAVWFVLTFGAVWVSRRRGFDSQWADIAGAALFLGLGVARLIVGSAHGLHRWGLLFLLMIVGAVVFFLRLERTSGGSSGSTSWSSSCGGGCGGGGCGGGGCGGCGGG